MDTLLFNLKFSVVPMQASRLSYSLEDALLRISRQWGWSGRGPLVHSRQWGWSGRGPLVHSRQWGGVGVDL